MELIVSSYQEKSGYVCVSMDVFLANKFLDVVKLTTRTKCSLIFSCKLSFQIVDFKHIFSSTILRWNLLKSFPYGAYGSDTKSPQNLSASVIACTFRMMISHKRPLTTVDDILPLTNSALLTADTLLHTITCLELLFSIILLHKILCSSSAYFLPSDFLNSS